MTVDQDALRNVSNARAHARRRLMLRRGLRRLEFLVRNGRPHLDCLGPLRRWWGNGGATADPPYLDALSRLAARTRGPILECGSGLTTLLLAHLAGRRGIEVWSLEHHPGWHRTVKRHLASLGLPHVHLCLAPSGAMETTGGTPRPSTACRGRSPWWRATARRAGPRAAATASCPS